MVKECREEKEIMVMVVEIVVTTEVAAVVVIAEAAEAEVSAEAVAEAREADMVVAEVSAEAVAEEGDNFKKLKYFKFRNLELNVTAKKIETQKGAKRQDQGSCKARLYDLFWFFRSESNGADLVD